MKVKHFLLKRESEQREYKKTMYLNTDRFIYLSIKDIIIGDKKFYVSDKQMFLQEI